MGACKSRNTKSATEKMVDAPLFNKTDDQSKADNIKLRADAQPYVPVVDDDAMSQAEVKERWEIFLDNKKRDLAAFQRGQLRRQRDGNYTSEYRSLLVRPVAPWSRSREYSPDRRWGTNHQEFDVRGAWRSAGQKGGPSPPPGLLAPEAKVEAKKKRKPTTLKKAILAQRDGAAGNALWQKFDDFVQKATEKASNDPPQLAELTAETKVAKDDCSTGSALIPFGLSDRCYLSEAEDHQKTQRHRHGGHAIVRGFVDMKLTQGLEESVTNLLFTLRTLRVQEFGCDQQPRRYAVGFREVTRLLGQKAVECLVVAPDVEQTSGVLENKIATLVESCRQQEVPVVYALSRRQLGAAIQKNVAVSVLAIQNIRGAKAQFAAMLDEVAKARIA